MEFVEAVLILAKYRFHVSPHKDGEPTICWKETYGDHDCLKDTAYIINGMPYCTSCLIKFGQLVKFVFEKED